MQTGHPHGSLHSRRARAALARMPEVDPAIAALALWCSHRDGDGSTRTDGDTILYGPDFEALALPEQTGLLAHHVLHVALRHSARQASMAERVGKGFFADTYNLATDAIVNEALIEGRHAVPRPAVRLTELLAATSASKSASDALAEWDCDRLYHFLTSGQGGKTRRAEAERYAQAQQFKPDLDAHGEATPDPEVWAGRLEQALAAGRGAGIGIGAALARLADLPATETPWEVVLRRFLLRAVSEVPRQSHKRPAHRWVAREAHARVAGGPVPVFEPGQMRDARRPRVVVALDTSSSITDQQLDLFTAETTSIARRSGAEAHLLGFDTEVHTQSRLDAFTKLPKIALRRGGGTAFTQVIETAQKLDPSVLLVLTDLDGPMGNAPAFPVIWVVPETVEAQAPFGQLVRITR